MNSYSFQGFSWYRAHLQDLGSWTCSITRCPSKRVNLFKLTSFWLIQRWVKRCPLLFRAALHPLLQVRRGSWRVSVVFSYSVLDSDQLRSAPSQNCATAGSAVAWRNLRTDWTWTEDVFFCLVLRRDLSRTDSLQKRIFSASTFKLYPLLTTIFSILINSYI